VTVLRAGKSIRLTIPPLEKPSAKFRTLMRELKNANPDRREQLVRQLYSCGLSEWETEKVRATSERRRRLVRRTQERELPLAESPAVGVGPTGNYHHDKEHWRRQIAADGDLSPLARRIANIIEAKYISNKMGSQLCAWCSITTLRSAAGCRRALVSNALHELEARGHCKLQSQGKQKPRLIALVLKRSETIPVLTLPTPTQSQPDLKEGPTHQESAAIETAPIEAVAQADSTALDALRAAAWRRAKASGWAPSSPDAIAISLTERSRAAPVKRAECAVTPESERKRIKAAEQRDADAAARERYDADMKFWQANQARSEPLCEPDYDPYPYNYNSSVGSPFRW
jgi:hypothetical protein